MTLIVGIKCTDGIVLGADGAATYGVMGQQTIRQPVGSKLQIRKGCFAVGVSGPVGLGQRLTQEAENLWEAKALRGMAPPIAMATIAAKFREHIIPEIGVAQQARQLIGPAAMTPALSQTLVAIPIMGEPCLFQFDQQGAPEMATKDLPFVAIGSGQLIADPFLALQRRLFWPDREPSLGEATFAVVWTLHHAIETSAGGVADPIQIVRVDKDNGKATQLSEDDLQEHKQRVKEAEDALIRYIASGGSSEAAEDPVPEPDSGG